ncbi:hypothetical protein A3A76_03035 [Candidatus Woesebacteria bacterium RIFCSPLOWO2_01_FULL_39_23]|uniref:Uncharacterized protein n=1 Tax=Candidatus Woesebacteria bacterium RIFCSPHIGHO2_01_FULL_40_22 TaxID=1802499 RepID=A0A1F7YJI8_9BACT|nr:MAG: hypothetical protein A2141_00985 [Candidatus Woesebacteria bacterium RBG_16_40_11]OGM27437.1 MAG: hypothetical protein A2628_01440 [Candidatus Woesebacteria bacterium RIFCSPHIGHO2_01_FULL_40_22]OGM36452.1 MAG: hypothetical protein A3E41_02910 [Candidatus Woesebacteria bacterium RIFCSPHIGHO2_12_FULL_38_9]OGM62609.1 MAG: hypothetical protein A3A76_03035 [Candidatus Woesebacteria bacterium RIFCSPLOWO2_01_FULL_39_23]
MSLTNKDLNNIKDLIKVTISEDETLVRKDDLKYLPTKDDFYEQTVKILKKLDNLEGSMDIVSERQSKHSDQIEALEKIHPNGMHSLS